MFFPLFSGVDTSYAEMMYARGCADPAAMGVSVEANGSPLANARVDVLLPAHSGSLLSRLQGTSFSTVTDRHGNADLLVPQIASLLVAIDHDNFAPLVRELQAPQTLERPFRLQTGFTWQGHVQTPPQSKGVETGEICASWRDDFEGWARYRVWSRCTELQGDGSFTLPGLPAQQEVDVEVRAPGFLPLRLAAVNPTGAHLQLTVGRPVQGQVLSTDGTPVPRAELRFQPQDKLFTQTNPAGGFQVAVHRFPARLHVTAPGFRPVVAEVRNARHAQHVRVTLSPGQQVVGRITSASSAQLKELQVSVTRLKADGSRQTRTRRVATDNGTFQLDLARPGLYSLTFRATGHERHQIDDVHLAAGERIDLGTLALDQGAVVQGKLFDAMNGTPVIGAALELLPQGFTAVTRLASRDDAMVSNCAGGFLASGLPPGRYELRVRHQAYPITPYTFSVSADEVLDLGNLYLHTGVQIQADIRDRDGLPRSGLSVRVFDPEQATLEPLLNRMADAAGRVQDLTLAPGRYRVQVYGERLLLTQEIEVPAQQGTWATNWTVGGTHLIGRVTDGGIPVEGGFLMFSSSFDPGQQRGKVVINAPHLDTQSAVFGATQSQLMADVDTTGSFEIPDVPPGMVQITYFRTDGSSVRRQVVVPEQSGSPAAVPVELQGEKLDGWVTDEQGFGIEHARVQLRDALGLLAAEAATDVSGKFQFLDLQPGKYRVDVSAEDHISAQRTNIEVDSEGPPLTVQLARGGNGGIELSLERTDGSPVARVMTTLLNTSGQMVRAGLTDTRGRYHFDRLAAGEYFVIWNDPVAGAGTSQAVQVRADLDAVLGLELGVGTSSRVACNLEACASRTVQRIALYSQDGVDVAPYLSGVSPALRFAEDGRISLGRITPGHYQLEVWTDERRWRREIEISSTVDYDEPIDIAVR